MAIQVRKSEKNSKRAIFKPGLWQTGFLDAVKDGTIFSRNE